MVFLRVDPLGWRGSIDEGCNGRAMEDAAEIRGRGGVARCRGAKFTAACLTIGQKSGGLQVPLRA
jgi:hypothetical protein